MRSRLVVVAEAERQIREAAVWWRVNRPAARRLFQHELARAFDAITTQPGTGARALDTAIVGVRRVHHEETVEVLALWHTSRGSGPPL